MRFIPFFELFYHDDKRERIILFDNPFPLHIYVNLLISSNHQCNRHLSILYLGKVLLLLKHLSLKRMFHHSDECTSRPRYRCK